jgi:ABC-2 type transport system ATP-binding protein
LESSIIAKKSKSIIVRRTYKWFDPKASNEFSQILKELSVDGTAILMATMIFLFEKASK